MAITIPRALTTDDYDDAASDLRAYFGNPYPGTAFTGASFDDWDSLGTRAADVNIFTADDVVAIRLLSVDAGPVAARTLLRDQRDQFADLLGAIGPDRDLADEPGPIDNKWPAWHLENQLREVAGIGLTIATKLIARKRPRLYPIWDTVVSEVLGTRGGPHLVPIHSALRTDPDLRRRIVAARKRAELPDTISELRVLDVIAWMQHQGSPIATHQRSGRMDQRADD
ncbi:hypothetical protein GTV32_14160 [Gordonia sp. SID5947]|uniref:DUF6308 family protein n=1 Tax=Gordonia sp. SID5947 TaxID=2690315 RepID=UPI00136C23BC|nr:DUF6308 family protein [Gordonia sp. SID5947]MYR07381.1 hypothetical protein [Gordonia sp. SID5947]